MDHLAPTINSYRLQRGLLPVEQCYVLTLVYNASGITVCPVAQCQ